MADSSHYRLPTALKPKHYNLTIRTDLEKSSFVGFVSIELDVKEKTDNVVFNVAELKILAASIQPTFLGGDLATFTPADFVHDNEQERLSLKLPIPLEAGSGAILMLTFSGALTGGMTGYYKSAYEHEGKKRNYALTQFEPTSARRAFPCWDEPLLKATFAINLISRADTVNLSNMPAASEQPVATVFSNSTPYETWMAQQKSDLQGDWKITAFESTPPMSTYIVAFANGHFEHIEDSYTSPISKKTRPLRVYATADIIGQTRFALKVKKDVLPHYERVFDVEYPLPKLDTLIAHDFDAGAMENWGLITGRTSAFLIDPERSDVAAQQRVAFTQSHEVAHMWFGNITTMEWWNYLYLNEGFATLMGEVIIADKVFPEWKVHSDFIKTHLNRALNLDAKLSSHAIEVDCPDANQINQIFDALSYSKAASVLRMLSTYVGEEGFLKGVSLYLKKRLFGNSVTMDLWEGISEATGVDVNKIMNEWITKIGFPVLTVTENSNGIVVRQDRFLETGHAEEKDNETIWNIPLGLLTVDQNGKPKVDRAALLTKREVSFAVDTSKPFKLNAGTAGVYRVLYTPERLAKIAAEAVKENSAFSADDRIGVVSDSFALATAGFAKVSSALTLVDIFSNEKEYLVVSSIAEKTGELTWIWWEHRQIVDQLNDFRVKFFSPLVAKLGYEYHESESPDTKQLRSTVISHAAEAGDQSVIKELKSRFSHFLETGDDSRIPVDLLRATYAAAVKYGGRAEYDVMKKIVEKPKTPSAGLAAMMAMGRNADPAFIKDTFDYILNKSRDQDIVYFFRGLSQNPQARRHLAKFFYDNYDTLYKRFEATFMIKYLVEISLGTFSSEKDYAEIEAFFKDKDISKYNLSLHQTLDGIRARIAIIKRSTQDVEEWLNQWSKRSGL